MNALHTHAATLHERLTTLEGDRKHLIGQRQLMADERDRLRVELAEAAAHLEQARGSIHGTFVNLALRTLGLVERQLGVIEGLEEREQDPDRLATLFKLDHFATVMRRHSENLLILAGAEHGQQHAGPVPLVDVVRAAVSEIERYERVRIATLPPHAHLAGFAADDISHLVAELLENASSFSPPDMAVEVSGWLLENGEVMLSVQDEGIGMTTERMKELNSRLAEFDPGDPYDQESGEGLGLGLYVVARLAHRHGVRVQLREQKQGGIAAVAVLPGTLLTPAPSTAVPSTTPAAAATSTPALTLPGADAEANSNVLYGRSTLPAQPPAGDEDPFIAAAEDAVRGAAAGDADEGAPAPEESAPALSAPEPTSETTMELLAPVLPVSPVDEPVETRGEPWAGRASGVGPVGTEDEAVPAETATHRDAAAEGGTAPTGTAAAAGPVGAPEAAPSVPTASAGLVEPAAPVVPTAPELAAEPAPESPEASRPRPFSEPEDAPRTTPTPTPDPYAIGPDAHERVPDVDESERVTDKGLPKRTPKISTPVPAPRPRTGGVDAEALRRRLGGFHRGAQEGRRDVEAEIADQTAELNAPAHDAGPHAQDVEPSGGTVEEASS